MIVPSRRSRTASVFDPPPSTLPPEPVDIDAPGFLPHKLMRSRLSGGDITMWPVASDADAEAIRVMAFFQSRNGYEVNRPFLFTGRYLLAFQPAAGINLSVVAERWRNAYARFGELTGLPLELGGSSNDDDHLIVSFDANTESCPDVWGFCDSFLREDYFAIPVHIVSTLADRQEVIQRVFAHALLRPNPQPGLLNRTNPAAELSLLEQQTLRMMYLRPAGTRWPDTEPGR